MRVDDANIRDWSQSGRQTYGSYGNYSLVEYSNNGTNMVKKENGFGISMNLVDAATEFQLDIEAIVKSTSKWATVYASYQHAATNVT